MDFQDRNIQLGAAAAVGSVAALATWARNSPPKVVEEKYQGGESYADPKKVETGLWEDIKSMGTPGKVLENGKLMYDFVKEVKSGVVDDKNLTMEKLIAMTGALPETSKQRKALTDKMVDGLWDSLQHPPMSYMGDKWQYRSADGSNNNPINPTMGAAGQPYAKTVRSEKKLHGNRPDPGLLFDMLMARDKGTRKHGEKSKPEDKSTFQENPAGISSMLFYHATIIIHDIFRTNRADANISDTSSYLDLAPLYGSSVADQMKVRTGVLGKLHPDTFHEKRLIAQPPGVNVMLVMYSRFHNYVVELLYKINERNRFPPTPQDLPKEVKDKLDKKLDEKLFQTARLIVGGLYINISLHDYLRGLTNTHHSKSSWTLDPRVQIDKHFLDDGTPRGMGNQVSAEFNMLYRFHSVISERDEDWLDDFLKAEVFPGKEDLEKLTPKELLTGLIDFEQRIPEEPKERTFGGLKRGADGRFNDAELVNILKESIEDPAGLFGPRMVPKALRVVEILGIIQARKWELASLNEFREFFKLKRHETFEDITSNKDVADTLRQLYDHPDMVELYPGLFLEDAKPALNPGCGGCPPYSVGRGVFSDAVTLVRSDRFYTLDYTPATLTSWGYEEVKQDPKTLGGSMFYKLIQRALPNWFQYNSLYVMQPFFTRAMNEKIAEETGTAWMYTKDPPAKAPRPTKILVKHGDITAVLKNQAAFKVPWLPSLNDLFKDKGKTYNDFMLGADLPANTDQRNLVMKVMYGRKEFTQLLSNAIEEHGSRFLNADTFKYPASTKLNQIDILRDVAIPVNARILADIFTLDLKTQENPNGSLNMADLYKHLLNVRIWGFNNNDPGMAWRRRAWAREGAQVLTDTTKETIEGVSRDDYASSFPGFVFGKRSTRPSWAASGSLRHFGRQMVSDLLKAGQTVDQVADICWLTALAGVGVPVGVFSEVLAWFLQNENQAHWAKIQEFAVQSKSQDTIKREEANKNLRDYVLEAIRLTSSQRNLRVCVQPATANGVEYKPGEVVICLFGPACKENNPEAIGADPLAFRPGMRPSSAYIHFGYGPHECLGREVAIVYVMGMLKLCAGLKNLRRAPGGMGLNKRVLLPPDQRGEVVYLNDNWSHLTFDPTTWKLHFDGFGQGVWAGKHMVRDPEYDIDSIKIELGMKYHAIAAAKKAAQDKASQDKAGAGKPGSVDLSGTASPTGPNGVYTPLPTPTEKVQKELR